MAGPSGCPPKSRHRELIVRLISTLVARDDQLASPPWPSLRQQLTTAPAELETLLYGLVWIECLGAGGWVWARGYLEFSVIGVGKPLGLFQHFVAQATETINFVQGVEATDEPSA